MKRFLALAATTAACLLLPQVSNAATITAVDLGTGAPPATLGGYAMTAFGDDGRPVINDVTTVPSPLGGDLGFGAAVSHREIGNGWASWSHGYTGDVYYSNGVTSLTMTMPAGTGAFYLYAEPNPFDIFSITATANDGTFLTLGVDGNGGANGYGFFAANGATISSITVSSTVDFAVGEFGIAAATVPEPATLAVFGLMAAGAFGVRRRMKVAV